MVTDEMDANPKKQKNIPMNFPNPSKIEDSPCISGQKKLINNLPFSLKNRDIK